MKNILLIAATSWELKVVKNQIKNLILKNIKVNFLLTWIWNYSTIFTLNNYIIEHNIDFIVNIWVCWYSQKSSDILQVSRIKNLANNKEFIVPTFFNFAKFTVFQSFYGF